MRADIKKVLTLRASSIGDSLMGKYFLENVHAAYPESRAYILVGGRGGMIKDLFRAYSWLTVIEANRKSPGSVVRAFRELSGCDLTLRQ